MSKRIAAAGAIATVALSTAVVSSPGAAGAATAPSTSWRPVYHTHFATATVMHGVTALGPKHAWTIGFDHAHGFVLAWNGKTWRAMKALPSGYLPLAVTATSPADLWVFSQTNLYGLTETEASRWNGYRWLQVPMPDDDIGDGVAAASSATDVWYSSGQRLLHWNGYRWSITVTPTPVAVANGPGGQVWEALAGRVGGQRSCLIARRWTGKRWVSVHVPHLAVATQNLNSPWFISLSIASARNIAIKVPTPTIRSGQRLIRGVFWSDGRWKIVAVPRFAGDPVFAATGRRQVWAGHTALFTGRHWLRAWQATTATNAMTGVPGTSATWAVGDGANSAAHTPQGWIWLNGKL